MFKFQQPLVNLHCLRTIF